MSYRLEPNEPVGVGIKRLVREQIDQALEQLTEAPDGQDEAVHDARKRFKKVRAALRLVRDEIGEDVYKPENICYRDAGRRLSEVRDSCVMIETLDVLKAQYDDFDEGVYGAVREQLLAEHEALRRERLGHDDLLREVAATIVKARHRVTSWPIERNDFSAIRKGLKRTYKRGRKGLIRAYDNPNPANFHEWRKRAKYFWYHTRILENVWPTLVAELADQVHDLTNYLGDAHDLAELGQLLLARPALFDREEAMEDVLELIRRRQSELKRLSRPLGERIYAEEPKVFVARVGAYWDAWRIQKVRI